MASITITLTEICAGGNHLTFSVTGTKSMTVRSDVNDMLSEITDEDAEAFVKVYVRLVKAGKTLVQARNALQAGKTVSG